jgi:hypothetical protein
MTYEQLWKNPIPCIVLASTAAENTLLVYPAKQSEKMERLRQVGLVRKLLGYLIKISSYLQFAVIEIRKREIPRLLRELMVFLRSVTTLQ